VSYLGDQTAFDENENENENENEDDGVWQLRESLPEIERELPQSGPDPVLPSNVMK